MPHKQLQISAPDIDFDLAVQALAFNGGAAIDISVKHATPLALLRLKRYLRDELAAHSEAQLRVQQKAQADAFKEAQEAALDQKAETLVLEIVTVPDV